MSRMEQRAAEERARRQKVKFKRHFRIAMGAAKLGLLNEDELTFALSARTSANKTDLAEITHRLEVVNRRATDRHVLVKAGQDVGTVEGTTKLWAKSLVNIPDFITDIVGPLAQSISDLPEAVRAAITGDPLTGGAAERFEDRKRQRREGTKKFFETGDMSVFTPKVSPPEEGVSKKLDDIFRAASGRARAYMGLPEDRAEAELYAANFPLTSQIIGTIATYATLSYLARVGRFVRVTGPATLGRGKDAAAKISQLTPSSLKASGAGAAGGALLGYTTNMFSSAEDPEGHARALSALRGAGAGFFALTVLTGKPIGLHARKVHNSFLARKYKRAAGLGETFRFAPRLTVGNMLEAGVIGATLETTRLAAQGTDTGEAIAAGLNVGMEWMMGDIAAAKIGSAFRWARFAKDFQGEIGMILNRLLPGHPRLGAVGVAAGQTAINAGIGAGLGAAAAPLLDKDRTLGAIEGAIAGAVGFAFLRRARSVLPRRIIRNLERGEWSKLTPEEAAMVSGTVLRDVAERSALHTLDPAERELVKRSLGRSVSSASRNPQYLSRIAAEINQHQRRLEELMGPDGVIPSDPALRQEVYRTATRMHQLREAHGQALREMQDAVFHGPRTPVTARGLPVEVDVVGEGYAVLAGARIGLHNLNRTAQSRMRELMRGRAQASEARRAATQLEISEQLNARFNQHMKQAADDIETLNINDVYDEIALATGDDVAIIKARLGDPHSPPFTAIETAQNELAFLRASSGSPLKRINAKVNRRTGLSSDIAKSIGELENITAAVDGIHQALRGGQSFTVSQLRSLLGKFGFKVKVDPKSPTQFVATFPFIGKVTGTIDTIFTQAKLFLGNYKPALIVSGLGLGAGSITEAGGLSTATGFIPFNDAAGKDGMAWYGKASALATLATVGLVLTKGFPVRIREFPRRIRQLMANSNEFDREVSIGFFDDGTAEIIRGGKGTGTVKIPKDPKRQRAVIFSIHNHPIRGLVEEQALRTKINEHIRKTGEGTAVKGPRTQEDLDTWIVGAAIHNSMPSVADYFAASGAGLGDDAILGVITPLINELILAAINPVTMVARASRVLASAARAGTIKVDPKKVQSLSLSDQIKFLNEIENNAIRTAMSRKTGIAYTENVSISTMIGEAANILGAKSVVDTLTTIQKSMLGASIIRGVSDADFESLINFLHVTTHDNQFTQTTLRMLREQTEQISAWMPGIINLSKIMGREGKERMREILLGGKTKADALVGARAALPRVAAKGDKSTRAILPSSITPQAVTKPALTLESFQEWGAHHGVLITRENVDGVEKFVARTSAGTEGTNLLSAQIKLSDLRTDLARMAGDQRTQLRRRELGVDVGGGGDGGAAPARGLASAIAAFPKEAQLPIKLRAASIGSGLGFLVGTPLGGILTELVERDPWDEDATYLHAAAGGMIGALIGGLLAGVAAGRGLTRQAANVVKFFRTADDEILPAHRVERMMGHTSVRPMKKGKVDKSAPAPKGPSKATFFRFPVSQQIRHLRLRIEAISNTANLSSPDRLKRLERTLSKFTPAYLPPGMYDEVESLVIGNAQRHGMDEAQAHALWSGFVFNMMAPMQRRAALRSTPNLLELARTARPILGSADDLAQIRSLVLTAEVMAGPPPAIPEGALRSAGKNLKRLITPLAKQWQEMKAIADSRDFEPRGRDPVAETGDSGPFGVFVSALRPPEHYRSYALSLMRRPDKKGIGQDIYRLFSALMSATENIRVEMDERYAQLNRIFAGIDNVEDRKLVRRIIENEAFASEMLVKNKPLHGAAMDFKVMLDDIAEELGIPQENIIENYFPWVYTQRTIRQFKEAKAMGLVPDDMLVPWQTGIPEYKLFKHLLTRTNEAPMGELIEDPLEAGLIYLTGAVRKKHLDPVATTYTPEFFKSLSNRGEGFIASDMAKWYMDIFGIPTKRQIKGMERLRATGITVEAMAAAFNFNSDQFQRKIIERYFLGPGATARMSKMIRSTAFYTKIGGSFISALVNLTQLMANTGTDIGITSLFVGGIQDTFQAAAGKLGQTLEKGGQGVITGALIKPGTTPRIAGFLNLKLGGQAKLKMMQDIGVWSDATKRILDRMSYRLASEREVGFALPAGLGLASGTAAAFLTAQPGEDNALLRIGQRAALGSIPGLALGLTGRAFFPRLLRHGLKLTKDAIVAPFSMVEILNRSMTAGGARVAARSARLVREGGPEALARSQVAEAAGNVGLGAAAGAGVGAAFSEEGERLEGAKTGALVGAAAGAGIAVQGRGAPRATRINRELDLIEGSAEFVPGFRRALKEMGPLTEQEIEKVYMRQVLDMTQFRFGREARPQALRMTSGEILGALQSFTLNQIEFAGSRLQSFWQSVFQGQGAAKNIAHGKLDMRFFRHMMLVGGMGAALQGLSLNLGSERDPYYWLSRIGFGLLPVIHYNEDAQSWGLADIGQHFMGPFVGDIIRAANTIWRLSWDPVARDQWDRQIDNLARNIFAAFRQMEAAPSLLGHALRQRQMDGLADMVENQEERILRLTNPAAVIRGEEPQRRGRGGQSSAGGLGGGGGFSGGDNLGGGGGGI